MCQGLAIYYSPGRLIKQQVDDKNSHYAQYKRQYERTATINHVRRWDGFYCRFPVCDKRCERMIRHSFHSTRLPTRVSWAKRTSQMVKWFCVTCSATLWLFRGGCRAKGQQRQCSSFAFVPFSICLTKMSRLKKRLKVKTSEVKEV